MSVNLQRHQKHQISTTKTGQTTTTVQENSGDLEYSVLIIWATFMVHMLRFGEFLSCKLSLMEMNCMKFIRIHLLVFHENNDRMKSLICIHICLSGGDVCEFGPACFAFSFHLVFTHSTLSSGTVSSFISLPSAVEFLLFPLRD